MLNKCVFIGRLARDPELRYTDSGTAVTNFTLAVERSYKNRNGNKDVDFIKIVTWRKLAEASAHNLKKGRLVAVTGSLQLRENESKGRNYINPEIVANEVKYLDSPESNKPDPDLKRKAKAESNYENQNTSEEEVNNDFGDEDIEVPF